jgi:hypothetical protein
MENILNRRSAVSSDVIANAKTRLEARARSPRSERSPLSVAYLPLDRLKPDPGNVRRHNEKQIRQIARSIEAFGFNVPILVDVDGNVIAGHARLAAARRLGFGQVPAIRLEHLSQAQKRAFMVADNRLAEVAVWDDGRLGEELKALVEVELDFDIEAIGFEMSEIDLGIEMLKVPKRRTRKPRIPAAGPSVSRAGDLWRLGPHELFCGDARDGEDPAIRSGSEGADCDGIVRRWQAATGATARHGVSGTSFDETARLRAAEARGAGAAPAANAEAAVAAPAHDR